MAEIAGATVTFTDYSAPGTPRVLNIPDTHGDVTVQDLWDTLSAIAASLENLVYKKLVDRPRGGGKGVLSATKSVGISLVANNVQAKFEDLPGPTYTIKRVVDGNFTAIDHLEAALEAMASSTFVNWKNEADVSAAILTPATDAQLILDVAFLKGLQDGSLDIGKDTGLVGNAQGDFGVYTLYNASGVEVKRVGLLDGIGGARTISDPIATELLFPIP